MKRFEVVFFCLLLSAAVLGFSSNVHAQYNNCSYYSAYCCSYYSYYNCWGYCQYGSYYCNYGSGYQTVTYTQTEASYGIITQTVTATVPVTIVTTSTISTVNTDAIYNATLPLYYALMGMFAAFVIAITALILVLTKFKFQLVPKSESNALP